MSTILDALRKVERERDVSHDHVVDAPTRLAEPRRRLPVWLIVMGVIVGFTIGGVLEWRFAEPPATEIAALPAAPPPPAIAVPRPPVPPAPDVVAKVEPPSQANAQPAIPPAAAPSAAPPESVAIAIPEAAGTAPVGGRTDPRAQADRMLAAIDKEESALEPSPFTVPRDEVPSGQAAASAPAVPAPAVPAPPPPVAARRAAPRAEPPANDQLAAVAPPTEVVPEVEPVPEVEAPAEPEATPEALVDTGRSPPGAPKVALSFLQWSADPAKRFAFISIDGAATQRVREGEVTSGMMVAAITPSGVQFKREGTTFVIRPRH